MKGNCGECERRYFCEIDPDKCDEWADPTPQTNADRIRAMSDEELAEEFALIAGWDREQYRKAKCIGIEKVMLDWLKQSSEGE